VKELVDMSFWLMMDDSWPFGAKGVMKGVFWAIDFL
jgi:hypothetical protein